MTHPATIFPISALAVSAILLLSGCGDSGVATDEYGSPIAVESEPTASPAATNANAPEPTVPVSETATTVANTTEPVTSDSRDFSVELLSREAIARIAADLGPEQTLITDHSFSFDLSDGQSGSISDGKASLVVSEAEQNTAFLSLDLYDADGNNYPLPSHAEGWWFQEVQAVSFDELNGDGQGPDIIVIADYITGIGPTGSQPFSVAKAYFYDGNNQYRTDEAINELLVEKEVNTIAGAKAVLLDRR
ncbi:MAG: hypothetical protein AAFY72_01115 [Cyanobacteria bacterium J06649_4]